MGTIVCILALLLAGHGLGLIIKMRMFCLLIKRVETKYIKKIDGIVVDVDTYVKDGKLLMRPSVEFTTALLFPTYSGSLLDNVNSASPNGLER